MNEPIKAYQKWKHEAQECFGRFKEIAPRSTRVPGCDTAIRMAVRLEAGRTMNEAVAREYLYRWRLALNNMAIHMADGSPAPFADHYAPHALGM